jgi:hypothetical protein
MDDAVKITVIATGFGDGGSMMGTVSAPRTFVKPVKMSMADTALAQQASPSQIAASSSKRLRSEMGETEARMSGSGQPQPQSSDQEDLFSTSGVPVNQLDVPSVLRKKK